MEDLPDGLYMYKGKLCFECRSCRRDAEWEGDIDDFDINDHQNVCGRNERCLP